MAIEQHLKRGDMKIEFSWEFSEEEMAAIGNHLGEEQVDAAGIKEFLQIAVREAVERAIVERKASDNDPSSNTGP
ncbi:MAG: hypothetical protein WA869_16630 [Alloacidobacterium sp.]|jgi:hypothetical protein